MSLRFSHASLITVNANPEIDISLFHTLPQDHVDLAVIGIGNFASGSYTQKSDNVDDIVSQFSLNATAIAGAGFYILNKSALAGLTAGVNLSDYGNTVADTADNLEIVGKQFLGNHNTGENRKWFANLETLGTGDRSTVSTGNSLKKGKANGSAGAVLVQAAGAALFKKLGKNAALNNDTTIATKQNRMANDMANAFVETSANYKDSKIFKSYLTTGRYSEEGADINDVVNYNLVNTNFDFIVQLTGDVTESNGTALSVSTILGSNAAGETKVNATSGYKFNIFMRLQHETDV